MKKLLLSALSLGLVAVVAVFATQAFFSDEETSVGNNFTAGAVDLLVDSEQHYNGNVCQLVTLPEQGGQVYQWVGNFPYPVPGNPCTGTWDSKNLTLERFFDFSDVKPGDYGENTISLTVKDNDSWLCAYVENLANNDNGLTEPESAVDGDDGVGFGELQDAIKLKIWWDVSDEDEAEACDNIWQDEELVLVDGATIDSNNGVWPLGQIKGGVKTCLGVGWSLPGTTGNEVQTDSVSGDIGFYVEQVRNNPNFVCPVR